MSAVIQVKVLYAQTCAQNLQRLFPDVGNDMIQDALYSVAQLMWSTARSLCPVRTGYLQSTITFQQRGKWSFELTALASYASYVEFGTRRMAPRHFLTNAVDMHRDDMLAAVAQAVEDAIEEVFA